MTAALPKNRICLFAGPTGGHLFPAVALAEKWRTEFPEHEIHLVTGRRAQKFVNQLESGVFDRVFYLRDFPFLGRNPFKVFPFLVKLFLAFVYSSRYLSHHQPLVCIGFGSFVSYPGMVLAACRKIPTLIHEQNVIPGKANEWLLKWVDCVAVTFERTWKEKSLKNCRVIGLPLRENLVREGKLFHARFDEEQRVGKFRVLIMGGSQGARKLNNVFLQGIKLLNDEEKSKIAVNHITGMTDYDLIAKQYQSVGIQHQVIAFSDNIHECYGDADMAITRAGANTLFELALFKLPALVIPYPHAGSHQSANAAYFESQQCVFSCPENVLRAEWIVEKIRFWMNQPEALKEYRQRMAALTSSDAASELVKLAEQFLKKESLCKLSTVI